MKGSNPGVEESRLAGMLRQAEGLCVTRGVRLTPQRRRVLRILCSHRGPMGAYEILDQLGKMVAGVKPPTVYRALEFLRQQGLVHRLESLQAFVSCDHPGRPHSCQFLICRDCGRVDELRDEGVDRTLGRMLEASGFEADSRVIEVTGLCARCSTDR